jgi:hypothetical protein
MHGKELMGLVKGEKYNLRDEFLCEHLYSHPKIPKSEGIRTKNFKYFRYIDFQSHEEIYDLTKDPHEMHNLIYEDDYTDIVNELREDLLIIKQNLLK